MTAACASAVIAGGIFPSTRTDAARTLEPPIIPTVHPTLTPSSAITTPMIVQGDDIFVWRKDTDQRILLQKHAVVELGYRSMKADRAIITLTPIKDGGEGAFDVAIYLRENVVIEETSRKGTTKQFAKELLVTTRISEAVKLVGAPTSKAFENETIVKRGDELRLELLTKPAPPVHIPTIVITDAESALQNGWIARGPNNRIIIGPGELVKGRADRGTEQIVGGGVPAPAKPRPQVFATGDRVEYRKVGDEQVTIIHGAYLFRDTMDGKPPVELRAQQMVLFSPPADAAKTQDKRPPAADGPAAGISRSVTGVFLEGDVQLDVGNQSVKAEKLYYDFTSDRAIMLDAVLSAVEETRNIPLYMRAKEIRQLARGEYAAKSTRFSTSEFHLPHYHIGASSVYLQDVTSVGDDGKPNGPTVYEYKAKDTTLNVRGVPIFYWPMLAGDTSKNDIPLRKISFGVSKSYGMSIMTDWDIFGLMGKKEPSGVNAGLSLDYFGKRGPGGGVNASWKDDDHHGLLRSYAILDQGQDRLGRDRTDLEPEDTLRGRVTAREQWKASDELTLSLQASYLTDPNFVEQFFRNEFDTDSEPETSAYLKWQRETQALTFLAKYTLFDFTATADQIDDQFTTNKIPEVKYWRIGDSVLDMFTYYSESGLANMNMNFSKFTPDELGLNGAILSLPASLSPASTKFKDYYKSIGWRDDFVVRADSRHELTMPLQIGDAKIAPYVSGRVTAWDQSFPETESGSTVRAWGSAGVRSSMQFWKVYEDVHSTFWDLHRMRHVVEPQFNMFVAGTSEDRKDLQPYDRDVEQISSASGTQLTLHQKWVTKRGGPGAWRNVDWLVVDVSLNNFYNKDKTGMFFTGLPVRGMYMPSRPELSLVQDSITVDATWRVGERARILAEMNYGLNDGEVEHLATGLAVDQTDSLSWFIGNRYVADLKSDEWTIATVYKLTRKYTVMAAQSYDFSANQNILSSLTLMRKLPRFNTALTLTYDTNANDTSVIFSMWPEGLPQANVGTRNLQTR